MKNLAPTLFASGPCAFVVTFCFGLSQPAPELFTMLGLAAWMILWWITDVVPMAITALLPAIVLPLTGLLPIGRVTEIYGSDIIFLFLGGFLLSAALEKWGVHLLFADWAIRQFGHRPSRLLLGVMLTTGFLSLWISNSAAAFMMYPLAIAICRSGSHPHPKFEKALLFGVAYAASIGGVGTIIGSPPNLILVGYLETIGISIGFLEWALFGIPLAAVGLFMTWAYLNVRLLYTDRRLNDQIRFTLPKTTRFETPQMRVTSVFLLMVCGWLFRPMVPLPGLTDVGIALIGAALLFCIPSGSKAAPTRRILEADDLNKVAWPVLLMFGGGLALARGIEVTRTARHLGDLLTGMEGIHPVFALSIIVATVMLLTEIGSNTAIAAVFIPLFSGLAVVLEIEPIVLATAIAMAASLSFMLPMATPPSAIIFQSGKLAVREMVRVGFVLDLLFAVLIVLLVAYLMPSLWS